MSRKSEREAVLCVSELSQQTRGMHSVKSTLEIYYRLKRLGAEYARLCFLQGDRGLTEKQQRRLIKLEDTLAGLVKDNFVGLTLKLGGDYRGFTVKLKFPSGLNNDYAGEYWGIA